LIAPISVFIRRAFAVRADLAFGAVTETPKENWASSGTVVTIPVPCTVIVRGVAEARPAPNAAAARIVDSTTPGLITIADFTSPGIEPSQKLTALYIELTTFGYGELLVYVPREVGAVRKLRLVVPVVVVLLLAFTAASAKAVARMPVGFFDDPSFRWAAEPTGNLASAQRANGSIIHVLANWSTIAPTKPAHPLNGSDPAYHLSDLDALSRSAQKYGFEVLLTIYGTPKWANGGKTPNYPPTNLSTLTQFSQMLAARYNGTNPGYGVVTRFSVWNEPNLALFLKPQFSGKKIVSPGIYARLYMAAYKGIKAGNKTALVAAGETSNRGHNAPTGGVSDSVAPATFAHLVSVAAPKLPFDAWATHPYPSTYALGPAQKVAYPNVAFSTMNRFGADLQTWFHRRVPIWVTEYGEQTKPEYPAGKGGISYAKQAVDVKKALQLAAASPYVEMFVWFIFRDSTPQTWFSGIETKSGTKKPAYTAFAAAAKGIVGHDQFVTAGKKISVKVAVPIMTYHNAIGAKVGMTYYLYDGKKLVAIGQPLVPIQKGGTITVPVNYKAAKGKTYSLVLNINDKHGFKEKTDVLLLPSS
jgi:hypothetical protein